jgi:hypothetical protein
MGLHDVEYFGQNNRTMRAGFDLSCSATTPYAAAFTLSEKYGEYVPYDVSASSYTITLPAVPYDGMTFHFSDVKGGGAFTLTVDGNGKNINDAATLPLSGAVPFRQRKLRYSSATGVGQWIVIGGIG